MEAHKRQDKIKIAVLGVGGVGGYFGGKLAARYTNSDQAEVIFFARGASAEAIQRHGLRLITNGSEQIVHPTLTTSDPQALREADFILCCVKSFDLEPSLQMIASHIEPCTVVLPLLNGFDAAERARRILPNSEVWEGCVYVVARLTEPGVVRQVGAIEEFHFGSPTALDQRIEKLAALLRDARINSRASRAIRETIWEKFLFISPLATATSLYDRKVGALRADATSFDALKALLAEVEAVARANRIALPDDAIEKTLDKIKSLPDAATSSMHGDLQEGKRTEVDALVHSVVRLGQHLGVATPAYEGAARQLEIRACAGKRG